MSVLVATQNNKVYGLDPATGALRWPAPLDLGAPWKAVDIGACPEHRLRAIVTSRSIDGGSG